MILTCHLGYSKSTVYEAEEVEVDLVGIDVSNKRLITRPDSPVLSLLLPGKAP